MTSAFGIGVMGIGTALPPHIRTNDYWNGKLKPRDENQRKGDILVVERSARGEKAELPKEVREAMARHDDLFRGAVKRHILASDAEIADLEADACRRSLADAGVGPEAIDVLLCGSLIPDNLNPLNAPAVASKCGLSNAAAWNVEVGCASFQAQLVMGSSLIRSGLARYVLCVQSAAMSRMLDDAEPMSVGFGDGAAAAVLGPVGEGYGLLGTWTRTDGAMREGVVVGPVSCGKLEDRWWEGGKGPFRISTRDAAIGKSAGQNGPTYCKEACLAALAHAGLTTKDVSVFVANQSVGWFVDACRRMLELPEEKAIDTFPEIANIGGAAILFNLARARDTGRLRHDDVVLAYSPAAGFTRSAVVMRWSDRGSDHGVRPR